MIKHLSSTLVSPLDSPWHLSQQQIEQFDQLGYIILEQRLPSEFLHLLQQSAAQIEQTALEQFNSQSKNSDFLFNNSFFNTFLNRALHFHLYGQPETLAILGCPQLLAAAESLCGTNVIPTVDMMVFKHQYNHAIIPWHQDIIYPSDQYRIATMGIYLEDAKAGDGALRILPRSQHKKHDICQIMADDPQDFVEIAAKAGDVVIHNPMCVHGSSMMLKQSQRRTIYYEYRPIETLFTHSDWNEQLIKQRIQLFDRALKYFKLHCKDQPSFNKRHEERFTLYPPALDLNECYLQPLPFNTANFCSLKPEQIEQLKTKRQKPH